jgi:fimbrial chaperone protein
MKPGAALHRAVLAFAALVVGASAANAGSLAVSPIRIELGPGQRSVTVTVRNDGDQATLVQTQLVSWSQADGEERLEPTGELLASPPIFTIAPAATQIVRIALRRPADADRERAYRLLVTEVPGPPQPGFTGAQFALKLSLPVFVDAAGAKTAPQVAWSATRDAAGALVLSAFNSGSKHVQVRAVDVFGNGAEVDGRFAGLWYILAGQRRSVTIAPAPGRTIGAAGRIRIRADTDAGALAADVALDAR